MSKEFDYTLLDNMKEQDNREEKHFYIHTYGCQMNEEDSEKLSGMLKRLGYTRTEDKNEAEIILFNTCCVRENAENKVFGNLGQLKKLKEKNPNLIIGICGCMMQQEGMADKILKQFPYVNIIFGTHNAYKFPEYLNRVRTEGVQIKEIFNKEEEIVEGLPIDRQSDVKAFVTIMYGCNNFCTYCIIPKIRGKFRSRLEKNILDEVNMLAKNGVKEIILIAQDLTDYGVDIYGKRMLHDLISKISEIENIEWIRLLYCYPEEITDELIEEIAKNKKVVKYLDLPIQHISSDVLKKMGRRTNKEDIINKINTLRNKIEGIALRTSLIVGFPGETEENFNELESFLKDYKLENVGVFSYSQEEDTPAAKMDNQIDEDIKAKRQKKLMEIQRKVVKDQNKLKIGKIYDTIIDGNNGDYYIGRSYEMAPEIDGLIYIKKEKPLNLGDIVKVKISDIMEYDLMGEVLDEFSK